MIMMSSSEFGTGIIYHTCNNTSKSYPIQSSKSSAEKVIKFCYGFDHIVLLKENGFIQQISRKDHLFDDSFQYLQQLNIPILDIAFGKEHGLALTGDHEVCSFGANTFGQLGIGTIGNTFDENNKTQLTKQPQFIDYFMHVNQKIIQITCGSYHSCALSKTGDIYTWGQGKYGQLGTKVLSIQILPRYVAHIPNPKDVIKNITCGPEGTAAISKSGALYQWGYGQSTPIHIHFPKEDALKVKKLSIGFAHSLCLTECGKLYGWGLCMYGQLGCDVNNNKKITTPLLLSYFADFDVYDIECCGLYTVICTVQNGIYILGFNDSLFDGKRHVTPFKLNLTTERIRSIGCSRYDFAVITASSIRTIHPSVCCANGTRIEIEGHGFYKTAFEANIKFIVNQDVEIIQTAQFESESDRLKLCVTTPNLHDMVQISYPYKVQICVAIDGSLFSDPYELYVVENPDQNKTFNVTPSCGDVYSGIECVISDGDESDYIARMSEIKDLRLDDIKIKLVSNTKSDEDEAISYHLDGVCDAMQHGIRFVMPSTGVKAGVYQIWISLDGEGSYNVWNTNTTFTAYNIQCAECKPDRINLSEMKDESIDIEMAVNGVVTSNREYIRIKLDGDDDEKKGDISFCVTDCVYESQSARDIAAKEEEIKQMYIEKRAKNETDKEKELSEIYETRKEKDAEREKWLAQMEKDKKKKKKAADIEAFEAEVNKVNAEWESVLKEREIETRKIERKYKLQWMAFNKEEKKIAKEKEVDDGSGYLKCSLDISTIKQWKQPNKIRLQISCNNGISFSDLHSIPTIAPQIKHLSPKCGLFSDSNQIKMFVDGFDLSTIDKDDLKLSLQDTDDKMVEIETFEVDTNFISMTIGALSIAGEKEITLKYQDWFQIKCIFFAFDAVKIASITPNTFTMTEEQTAAIIKIQLANEMNGKYVDECYVEVKGNDDKSVVFKGRLNENGKDIEAEFDANSIGAIKKAQLKISFNYQQWIAAKQTIAIK
eukprot:274563_1